MNKELNEDGLHSLVDPTLSGEDGARSFLRDVLSDVRSTLNPKNATLTEDDAHSLRGSLVEIPSGFEAISKLLEPMRRSDPETFRVAFNGLHQLMRGAFFAGAFCVISDSSRNYIRAPQREGGKQTGQIRGKQVSDQADLRWRNRAKIAWDAKRGPNAAEKLSQEKLAEEISDANPSAPSIQQIVRYIRDLDRGNSSA